MTISAPAANAFQEMREKLGDRIILDEEIRSQYCSDYGRMVDRMPGAIARCSNAEEVAEVVRFCRQRGIAVTARGQAHSQSGQSTSEGGVLIETAAMQKIHEINGEELYAICDAGVIWRDIVAETVPQGLVPPTLTNNLGVSIGGTMSVAGIGVASFRYGIQADNAIEMEVVTGTGEVVNCSAEENSDLFNAVRCGFGQFGIITKVKMKLRHCQQKVRMYHLLYDDLGVFMKDSEFIMNDPEQRFHTLESRSSPCPIFTRRIGEGLNLGEGMQLYAYWLYPLFLTVEYEEGEEPDDDALLSTLNHYRFLRTEEYSQLEFCNRLVPVFDLWHRSGGWEMTHPWMETILPWDKAQEFIEMAQSNLPPQALGAGGHVLLWPAKTLASEAPLFIHPQGDLLMGWGILPAVPQHLLDQALVQLDMASELSLGYGAKRYLSGYVTFNTVERWQEHFGDRWPQVLAAKTKYDPDGIMNPGFIQYE